METLTAGASRMHSWLEKLKRRYQFLWFKTHFKSATAGSVLLFIASVIANTFAGLYAAERASNPVTDIILSNTPVFDVDVPFVYGVVVLVAFLIILIVIHPKRIPFTLYSLSLFFFIRSAFVSMTHLAPYPVHTAIDFQSKLVLMLFAGGDEFFSGHTGTPFLMALVFWREKWLRYLFLAWSFFFAAIVLLGHVHYTIDVFSAFFITYGIYHLALWLFPKEHAMFLRDETAHPIEI